MTRKDLFGFVIQYFEKNMPVAETELVYHNPFQLLVSVILSAQCTDKRVNMTTPALFKKYPTPEKLSKATFDEVFPIIKSISYPSNKTKHLIGMAQMMQEKFNGQVPSDTELLQQLPGVGRKTAHVIASCLFNQPKMAVDTHVQRVSSRIGLTRGAKNPLQTELQLVKYIPEKLISKAHHWLILHGRYVCIARKPKCEDCGLKEFCKYYQSTLPKVKPKDFEC